MQLRTKHINLTLVWLFSLMFLSHTLIPHHHHYDSISEHFQNVEHNESHSEDNAQHCHAFNEFIIVVSEVSSNTNLFNNSTWAISPEHSIKLYKSFFYTEILFQRSDFNIQQFFYQSYPSRGSPCLA